MPDRHPRACGDGAAGTTARDEGSWVDSGRRRRRRPQWPLGRGFGRRLRRDPLVLPFYAPAFILFLGSATLVPVLPLYAESFGVTYGWIGAVTSAQALGMLVADLPSGLLVRRLGQKRGVILGMAVGIGGRLGMAWAGTVQQAFALNLVSGFGMALYGIARHAYVTAQAPEATRGSSMALFGGLMRAARFLAPTLGGFVAAGSGLRVPFVIAFAIALPAIVLVAVFMPGSPSRSSPAAGRAVQPGPPTQSRQARRRLVPMLRGQARLLLPAGVGHVFVQMVRSGRGTILPLYASDVLGLSVEYVGLLLTISAALEMLTFWPAGWLMDNVGRKYAYVPSFSLQALGMACIPLTGGFLGLLGCSALVGLGNGLSSGGMMTLGSDLAPTEARSEFLGVWRLIGDTGGTAGPAAVGFVADALTLPAASFTLAASGLLAALTFGFLLPETRQSESVQRSLPARR